MNTVFRINGIKQMSRSNRLFEVNLTLTSDNDIDLRALTDRVRAESFPEAEGWYRLGLVLIKMDQFDNACEVYEVLLDQTAKENDKAPIYYQLGWVKYNQREYQEAITFYEKSVEIYQRTVPPNYLSLGNSYNNIGLAYYSMGDYPKALSSHEKSLAIRQQSLPSHHLNLAISYNNIGIVCKNMADYAKALSSFEQALAVQQKTLPSNHPDLANTYDNISHAYETMGDNPKALSSHEKPLAIQLGFFQLKHR
jgi:tetratricopeptide (TPR) repeat protein